MAKDTLKILEHHNGYAIGWYLPDDGEFGLMLGASNLDIEDKETKAAMAAIRGTEALHPDNISASDWSWESKARAQRALTAAKLAAKHVEYPMPEWATKALAAGWTPPKGWKPGP